MLRLVAAAAGVSFLAGVAAGTTWTIRVFKVNKMEEVIENLQRDRARYRAALGVGQELDTEADTIEATNDKIERAIFEKAKAKGWGPVPPVPPVLNSTSPGIFGHGGPDVPAPTVCLPIDGMREIGRFR